MDLSKTMQTITDIAILVGFRVIGAIVFYLIGRWLISFAIRLVSSALERQKVDPTLLRYIGTVISVTLNIILVVAILGYFGVETTSFAAILAAAGIAIGMAWSGLLANFAAGAFMIVLRPFKVGDFVTAAGVTGTVKEIGLFVTAVITPDNVMTLLGNNKIFADTIQNFSANPYRRVDLKAQLAHPVDHNEAIRLLKERVSKVPNTMATPAPDVELLDFNINGPVLVDTNYTVNGNIIAVGQSPKTEYMWFETGADDAAGRRVAEMRMLLRFMKASSPKYAG